MRWEEPLFGRNHVLITCTATQFCAHRFSCLPLNTGRSVRQVPSASRCGSWTTHLKHAIGSSKHNVAAAPHTTQAHHTSRRIPQSQPRTSPPDWKQPAISLLTAVSFLAQTLGPVSSAEAKALFTSEEKITISIFKKNTPSVVNITNLASK